MSEKEELDLLDKMIEETKRELGKSNRDRLYLESELNLLIEERVEILYPLSLSIRKGEKADVKK